MSRKGEATHMTTNEYIQAAIAGLEKEQETTAARLFALRKMLTEIDGKPTLREEVESMRVPEATPEIKPDGRKEWTDAKRKAASKRMKKMWAARKAEAAGPANIHEIPKRKYKRTAAQRARMAEAQRKNWAKRKRA
jgi:hypothetical protein